MSWTIDLEKLARMVEVEDRAAGREPPTLMAALIDMAGSSLKVASRMRSRDVLDKSALAPFAQPKRGDPFAKTGAGTIVQRWIRCGKAACRCARGAKHGPYAYRAVWADGRVRWRYVRKADAADEQAACTARRTREAQHRAVLARSWQAWRRLDHAVRELRNGG